MEEPPIPLIPLHPDEQLILGKLTQYQKLSTEVLILSLTPGRPGSLKTRTDGTVVDGHHRLKVLRVRGFDVNKLPREIIPKFPLD